MGQPLKLPELAGPATRAAPSGDPLGGRDDSHVGAVGDGDGRRGHGGILGAGSGERDCKREGQGAAHGVTHYRSSAGNRLTTTVFTPRSFLSMNATSPSGPKADGIPVVPSANVPM